MRFISVVQRAPRTPDIYRSDSNTSSMESYFNERIISMGCPIHVSTSSRNLILSSCSSLLKSQYTTLQGNRSVASLAATALDAPHENHSIVLPLIPPPPGYYASMPSPCAPLT